MKELIRKIIKTINKENRKNSKLVEEQQKQIKELEENINFIENSNTVLKNRISQLERQNIEVIKSIKGSLKVSVSGLKGHLTKDKVISLIDEVK